jgi:hypothetical protein
MERSMVLLFASKEIQIEKHPFFYLEMGKTMTHLDEKKWG